MRPRTQLSKGFEYIGEHMRQYTGRDTKDPSANFKTGIRATIGCGVFITLSTIGAQLTDNVDPQERQPTDQIDNESN